MTHSLAAAYPLPSYARLANPIVGFLLRIGLPIPLMVLLTVRGRRTGQMHTTPVGLFRHENRRYLFSTFGESNWVRNLRASGTGVVSSGRRREAITAVELTPEQAGPVLQRMLRPYLASPIFGPQLRPTFPVAPNAPLGEFIAEAHRHPLFEVTDPRMTAETPIRQRMQ